jgi:hypothetical protein
MTKTAISSCTELPGATTTIAPVMITDDDKKEQEKRISEKLHVSRDLHIQKKIEE